MVKKSRSHVVVLNQFALPLSQGGGTRHTELFSRLEGWSHKIIAGNRNHYTQDKYTSPDPSFHLVEVPSQSGGAAGRMAGWIAYSAQAFWQTVRAPQVDVVYASTPHPLTPLAGWAAAKVRRASFVLEVRDLWPESIVSAGKLKPESLLHRVLSSIERFPVRRADAVVAVTQGWEEHFEELGARRLVVVPNGSVFHEDLETLAEEELAEFRPDVPGPFGVFAGAHGAMNGLEMILEAASQNPTVGFTLIGSGPMKADAVHQAREKGLRNVLFHDSIPKTELPRVLGSFDFGIHSIKNLDVLDKGMSPNKLFDYMACDLPVVSNAGAGLRRFNADGGVGVLGTDLGDAIEEMLLADDARKETWSRNRRHLMNGPYSRAQSAKELSAVLDGTRRGAENARGLRVRAARVVHVSSAHGPTDNRILRKEARALADAGFDVHLVTRGPAQQIVPTVTHHVINGVPASRLARMVVGPWKAMLRALRLRPQIIHIHDPELIPLGLVVNALTRTKVVFDAHEDLPAQVMGKHYLPQAVRPIVARFAALLETLAGSGMSAVVTATPAIARSFPVDKTVVVKNFPWMEDYRDVLEHRAAPDGAFTFGYVGGMSKIRGIDEMIEATAGRKLLLAGPADEYATKAIERAGKHVEYIGVVSADKVPSVLERMDAGMVLFHDLPNHREALPTKLMEYMASGIPFIATDFASWRDLVMNQEVCVFTDVSSSTALRGAVDAIAGDPEGSTEMGRLGREVFQSHLTFDQQLEGLLDAYRRLLG